MSTPAVDPSANTKHFGTGSLSTFSFWKFPEQASGWKWVLPLLLLVGATLALYAKTVYYGFVWDDFHYIHENAQIQKLTLAHLLTIWTQPYFQQYAPLHLSFLALVHSISGLAPSGYHLSQLLLQSGCVCLLYHVLRKMEPRRVALLASLVFAVYPPNVENVAWISETKSTLALFFFLLSFLFYMRWRTADKRPDGFLSIFFFVLSLLSKLSTIVGPVVFLAYDRSYRETSKPKKHLVTGLLILASAIAAMIQLHFAWGQADTSHTLADSSIVDGAIPGLPAYATLGSPYVRLLNFPRLILFYIRMLILPWPLSVWHMFRVHTVFDLAVAVSWAALIGLLWVLYRSPARVQFWQIWFYAFLFPVLQFVPNPIWVADRYLYIPAIGGFVLASILFFHLLDRLRGTAARIALEAAMAGLVIAFACLSVSYLPAWRNNLTLWKDALKTCPTSAFCHHTFGVELLSDGYGGLAAQELYKSVQLRPDPNYLVDLGDAYADGTKEYPKALLAYQTAIKLGVHQLPGLWARLAKVYYHSGQMEEATRALDAAGQDASRDPELLTIRAFVLWRLGNLEASRAAISRALAGARASTSGRLSEANLLRTYWGSADEASQLLAAVGTL